MKCREGDHTGEAVQGADSRSRKALGGDEV